MDTIDSDDNTVTQIAGVRTQTVSVNSSETISDPAISYRILSDDDVTLMGDTSLSINIQDTDRIWNVGDVILGTYEVIPIAPGIPFAEGGVGVVHHVYHREWDMDLAVKSPKPEIFKTETGKLSYEREAQTWIELGLHQNIVTCYLVRRIDDTPRLFAEFVGDGNLRDWINDGRLYLGDETETLARIVNIAIQFAWGLQHAHRSKLLHLDVKPANVMMSGMTAKVTDFGLSQGVAFSPEASELAQSLQASGMTPGFCSPEQFVLFNSLQKTNQPTLPTITLQSDIWSWAVSVLAMFYGCSPCRKGGQTARTVLKLLLKEEKQRDNRLPIPPSIIELLFHCFEEEPSRRPESMDVVAERMIAIYREITGTHFPRRKPVSTTWTPDSINNRAISLLDLNKPNEAFSLLAHAAKMHPWHPEVTYNQTMLMWRHGQLTDIDAADRLDTLVKARHGSAITLFALGLLQRERGNLQMAAETFDAAFEVENRNEIKRAIASTAKLIDKSCRCVERITLPQGVEQEVYIDNKQTHILCQSSPNEYSIYETATGQKYYTFKITPDNDKRLALSEDMRIELIANKHQIAMRKVGTNTAKILFHPIQWRRVAQQGENSAPKKSTWTAIVRGAGVKVSPKTEDGLRKPHVLFGHRDNITAIDIEQSQRFAVTGAADQTLRIWELETGRCVRTFTSLGGSVYGVYFGGTGKFILSLIVGGSIRFWNVELLCEQSFRSPYFLSHVSSSEEVGRQQEEMNQCCERINAAVETNDFTNALSLIERAKTLPMWESVRSSQVDWSSIIRHCQRKSLDDAVCTTSLVGHHDVVSAVTLSIDGSLAASCGKDNTIRVWNLDDNSCKTVLEGHNDWVSSIAFTQDAAYIASASWDSTVRIWSLKTCKCLRTFGEKVKQITQIAMDRQGHSVAIANGSGGIIVWSPMQDVMVTSFQAHYCGISAVSYSRDGRFIITGSENGDIAVWESLTGKNVCKINVHKSPVVDVRLTTDISHVVSLGRGGSLMMNRLADGKIVTDTRVHSADTLSMECTADDRFAITTSKDRRVSVTNLQTKETKQIEGHPGAVTSCASNLSGQCLVTGCEDGKVRVWQLFWAFDFEGWKDDVDKKAESYIKTLLTLFCPQNDPTFPPKLEQESRRRIQLELEYRGLGNIKPAAVKECVEIMVKKW
ncbi:MAG: protein kinase [Planctomycetaceae bacterium]|nr:protein kinase [Planctomycetaceae bacterium]